MHSSIYLISQDKTCNYLPDVAHMILPDCVDIVSKDESGIENIALLTSRVPELKIKNRSFVLLEDTIKTWQANIYAGRKNKIQQLLSKDPFTEHTLYKIAEAAHPRTGMMFTYENGHPQVIEDFILQNPTPGKYYIIQIYDYHYLER